MSKDLSCCKKFGDFILKKTLSRCWRDPKDKPDRNLSMAVSGKQKKSCHFPVILFTDLWKDTPDKCISGKMGNLKNTCINSSATLLLQFVIVFSSIPVV